MRIGCVVMASGAGTRFTAAGGVGEKLMADVCGAPLIARTVASVPRDRFELVLSTRSQAVASAAEQAVPDLRVVLHDAEERSASIKAGLMLGADEWDGCLFLPGDQPLVSQTSFEALARAFGRSPRQAWRLAWQGTPASPVLFPRSCFGSLVNLQGAEGGSHVLRSGLVPQGFVEAQSPVELWDVDTTDDLCHVAACYAERLGCTTAR